MTRGRGGRRRRCACAAGVDKHGFGRTRGAALAGYPACVCPTLPAPSLLPSCSPLPSEQNQSSRSLATPTCCPRTSSKSSSASQTSGRRCGLKGNARAERARRLARRRSRWLACRLGASAFGILWPSLDEPVPCTLARTYMRTRSQQHLPNARSHTLTPTRNPSTPNPPDRGLHVRRVPAGQPPGEGGPLHRDAAAVGQPRGRAPALQPARARAAARAGAAGLAAHAAQRAAADEPGRRGRARQDARVVQVRALMRVGGLCCWV